MSPFLKGGFTKAPRPFSLIMNSVTWVGNCLAEGWLSIPMVFEGGPRYPRGNQTQENHTVLHGLGNPPGGVSTPRCLALMGLGFNCIGRWVFPCPDRLIYMDEFWGCLLGHAGPAVLSIIPKC